jgi:hypothetical protein
MADIYRQQDQQIGNGAAEVVRRGAAAAHTVVEAAQQATIPGAETVQQAGAEVFRKAADTASRGPAAVAEEAQRTAQSFWAASQDMWRMLPGQAAMPGNMAEMPQAFAGLFGDMVRTNLRIGQELFRLANPMAMIEMQQKLVRSYLDAVAASQSMLLGAARGTAENAQHRADQARDPGPQGR